MTSEQIRQSFQIRRLAIGESISTFDCGDDDLNDFIINESRFYRQARLAVSYVIEDRETKQVVGYFSLANDKVSIYDFESNTEFNRFRRKRFVNEKRLKSYPAVKICRLGITNSAKGKSLGTLILDFVKSYFTDDNKTGCRFITVDAYADAVPFYFKNRFAPLSNQDESDHTRLLFFDLGGIENAEGLC